MSLIYFVPGFMGSELQTGGGANASTLWASALRLSLGQVGQLRLGVDGVSPGPPDGVQCTIGQPLGIAGGTDYYRSLIQYLKRAIHQYDSLRLFPVDWRIDLNLSAARLAAQVLADIQVGEQAYLVGHSVGGLVARLAYGIIQRAGQAKFVNRLLTIGTPHFGSYTAFQCLLGVYPLIGVLSYLSNAIGFYGAITWTVDALTALIGTWPGIYQCLPSLYEPLLSAVDPLRGALYHEENYPGTQPNRGWFGVARALQTALNDSTTIPPASVLTTVAGTGLPTPASLREPLNLPFARDGSTGLTTSDGDSVVTLDSALLNSAIQYKMAGEHFNLVNLAASNGNLIKWIYETNSNPSVATVPGNAAAALTVPPGIPVPGVVSPSTFLDGLTPKTLPAVAAGGGHGSSSGPGRGRRR